jgi:hypothetical protein
VPSRPYAELITGFDPALPIYADELWDEQTRKEHGFDQKDAHVIIDQDVLYINELFSLEEVVLPVEKGNHPYQLADMSAPAITTFLRLFMAPDYSLPFKAAGYFNPERGLEVLYGGNGN